MMFGRQIEIFEWSKGVRVQIGLCVLVYQYNTTLSWPCWHHPLYIHRGLVGLCVIFEFRWCSKGASLSKFLLIEMMSECSAFGKTTIIPPPIHCKSTKTSQNVILNAPQWQITIPTFLPLLLQARLVGFFLVGVSSRIPKQNVCCFLDFLSASISFGSRTVNVRNPLHFLDLGGGISLILEGLIPHISPSSNVKMRSPVFQNCLFFGEFYTR